MRVDSMSNEQDSLLLDRAISGRPGKSYVQPDFEVEAGLADFDLNPLAMEVVASEETSEVEIPISILIQDCIKTLNSDPRRFLTIRRVAHLPSVVTSFGDRVNSMSKYSYNFPELFNTCELFRQFLYFLKSGAICGRGFNKDSNDALLYFRTDDDDNKYIKTFGNVAMYGSTPVISDFNKDIINDSLMKHLGSHNVLASSSKDIFSTILDSAGYNKDLTSAPRNMVIAQTLGRSDLELASIACEYNDPEKYLTVIADELEPARMNKIRKIISLSK